VIVINPTGAVQKVEGLDRLVDKLSKTLPQNPTSAAAMQAVRNSFSDESMKQTFSQGVARLPDRAVKVGDSWTHESTTTNPLFGKATTTTISTLTGVQDEIATIATKLDLKFDAVQAPSNPAGMAVKVGESRGEGDVLFDVANGRQQRSTTRMTMSFSVSAPGPGGAATNMETVSKSVITVEIVP